MNPKELFIPKIVSDKTFNHITEEGKEYKDRIVKVEGGFTIRDYIAIEAMRAILTGNLVSIGCVTLTEENRLGLISKRAYQYADALIAESNKK